MGVPDYLLTQTVTRVRPVVTVDGYGSQKYDYGVAAARAVLEPGSANGGAWLQQDQRTEPLEDGRDPLDQRWLMVTNYSDIRGRDRIEWTGPAGAVVFEVEGPPEPAYTPGDYHHTESTLRVVSG